MSDNQWPDNLLLKEEDTTTPEQFNEAVSAAGRQAWWAVANATKKDPKTAQRFAQAGQIIVGQIGK
jgi:hypothetical protein